MEQATPSTASANILHCALELSKKSWLLAIQFPDREQPSLYPIAGGDAERLMVLRRSHRERSRLVRERTAHINRIKGLLFAQGIRGININSRYKRRRRASSQSQTAGAWPPGSADAGEIRASFRLPRHSLDHWVEQKCDSHKGCTERGRRQSKRLMTNGAR
jgi:hypothetical protein